MGTGTLAFIIFAFVVAQVAVLMGIGIFRQRRKYRDLESLPGEAPVAGAAQEFAITEPAWDGFREFLVKRRVIEDDARSVCSFYLLPADGQPLPVFEPGQFLTFRLQLEDPVRNESKSWLRALIQRAGYGRAAVALANKNARTAWALLTQGEEYKREYEVPLAA